jgi:hypothetical protein
VSFGKVKEALRKLERKGMPPNLAPRERHKRIWDQLVEDGYDPRTELPSRRSLDRYLKRLLVADATCAICPTCASPVGLLSGNVETDNLPEQEEQRDDGIASPSQSGIAVRPCRR